MSLSAMQITVPLVGRVNKIWELARRGDAWGTSEARQMLEHAIEIGRGGVYLKLNT
jgi:hypothetical protein